MPQTIRITRAAMAVLEETRRGDRWEVEPVYIGDGFQFEVPPQLYKRLVLLARAGEDFSAVILRAYREGGLASGHAAADIL